MKKLTAVFAALLTLVGLSGCSESFEKQNAEGTAYLVGLVSSIPDVKVRDARYVVAGPTGNSHNIVLSLETQSVDPAVISELMTQAYRISVQTLDHQPGTYWASFSVSVTDGNGTTYFDKDVGLKAYPTYDEVVEWLKTR